MFPMIHYSYSKIMPSLIKINTSSKNRTPFFLLLYGLRIKSLYSKISFWK
jgi:hypothetical protein